MSEPLVDYLAEASREADEAFEWYLERSPLAAEAFVRELDHAFALIASAPTVWPFFEAGTRKYVLSRFPYNIIYRMIPSGIQVIAVAHQRRKPGYWRARL